CHNGGRLTVFSLNDEPPQALPAGLSELRATSFRYFSGRRAIFIRNFVRAVGNARLVIYGHLGLAPLAVLQRLLSRASAGALLLQGIEAWHYRSPLHRFALRNLTSFVSISHYTL